MNRPDPDVLYTTIYTDENAKPLAKIPLSPTDNPAVQVGYMETVNGELVIIEWVIDTEGMSNEDE